MHLYVVLQSISKQPICSPAPPQKQMTHGSLGNEQRSVAFRLGYDKGLDDGRAEQVRCRTSSFRVRCVLHADKGTV